VHLRPLWIEQESTISDDNGTFDIVQIDAHGGQPEHGLTMVCIDRQRSFIVCRSLSISFQRVQGVGKVVVRCGRMWITCSDLREVMNRLFRLAILHEQHSKEADHILLPAIDAEE